MEITRILWNTHHTRKGSRRWCNKGDNNSHQIWQKGFDRNIGKSQEKPEYVRTVEQ